MPAGKTGGHRFKMAQRKIDTFNLAFHGDIPKQSFAKCAVCIPEFASPENAGVGSTM